MSEIGGKSILLKMGRNADAAVTFTDTGDLVGLTGHGLQNGDVVSFATIVTTTGITDSTDYFVVGATANTFQVSATAGGAALELTTNGTGTINEYYVLFGGLRSKGVSINAEIIDVTNHDSGEWRKILDGAGIRSASMSGSGVIENGVVFLEAQAACMANTLKNFQMIVSSDGTKYFQGSFKIASEELAGEYNAEGTYSLTLESSGPVTFV